MKLLKAMSVLIGLSVGCSPIGQQVPDDSYNFDVQSQAFSNGEGPVVCIDEGHNNFHTIEGGYKAFARLVRADGCVAIGFSQALSTNNLSSCDLLVIANALAEENSSDWSYPHLSAFTKNEILELGTWIESGGKLLLIADHAPFAGAARDLGAAIGILKADVYADGDGIPSSIDIFSRSLDTLHQHAILDGRSSKEFIDSIVTFTGQSAQVTQAWDRLISFGPNAIGSINSAETITEPNERAQLTFSIAGWSHGATRKLGLGRIVFLGEAAMCTAQLTGSNQFKMGINNQWANQNAQFCLNVVHWLTGFID